MDISAPHLKQSMSASRISSVDVSQLDKINAIPNKTTNNVLLDGLCQEDQLYLNALMDEESLDSDDEFAGIGGVSGSPWTPAMAERPMMNNKRIKRMKPSYTITMSLEDISYIRPSWGMSKGIKRINSSKMKSGSRGDKEQMTSAKEKSQVDVKTSTNEPAAPPKTAKNPTFNTYNASLAMLMLVLGLLMVLSYYVDLEREQERKIKLGIESHAHERAFEILKFKDGTLVANSRLRVNYGRGIPADFKSTKCSCQMYHAETRKHLPGHLAQDELLLEGEKCFACLDWAMMANLQIIVNKSELASDAAGVERDLDDDVDGDDYHHQNSNDSYAATTQEGASASTSAPLDEDLSITCYDIRWQSYDSLRTPLVDCIRLNEGEQWFGLGDTQSSPSMWPLNKFNQDAKSFTALMSNLTGEFAAGYTQHIPGPPMALSNLNSQANFGDDLNASTMGASDAAGDKPELIMGSHVDTELLSSSGFYVGNLRSDFRAAVQISAKRREICLSVACTDRCGSTWSRLDHLTRAKFKYRNNLLEYSICSASSWRVLASRLINERQRRTARRVLTMFEQRQDHTTKDRLVVRPASAFERLESTPGSSGADGSAAPLQQEPKFVSPILATQQQQQQQVPASVAQSAVAASGQQGDSPAVAASKRLHSADGIGLIERTIFLTSQEYLPNLDGQTLRVHVDKIVKLNLKTSPILMLDTRWQTYSGSLRINAALFPKAKLLFEILHNKGFKIVLTIKPYIDASIGMANLNQLLAARRLVTSVSRRSDAHHWLDVKDGGEGKHIERHQVESAADSSRLYCKQVVLRRESFFKFKNQTVAWLDQSSDQRAPGAPYFFSCKESLDGHCALIDLTLAQNRLWFIDMIKRSTFLSQEADAICMAGAHPEPREWHEGGYRDAMAQLTNRLFYRENLYVIPQWTGNHNYIQLAPRARTWDSLRSLLDSVLTLGMLGFSLVHPGSVWGDLVTASRVDAASSPDSLAGNPSQAISSAPAGIDDEQTQRESRAEEELVVRWLQLAVFLPILQFNDLAPIYKYNLQDQVQQLVRLRKSYIGPEIKKNLPHTALLMHPTSSNNNNNNSLVDSLRRRARRPAGPVPYQLPALRYTWANSNLLLSGHNHNSQSQQQHHQFEVPLGEAALGQQFMIGLEVLVAPVLQEGQRQKDIYLPLGIWRDELRQTNIRGGKWLRNYPIELHEIAWFTRARR